MSNEQKVSTSNVETLITEIENAFFDIPFGNTDFQCENFVIASSITPARAYRTIGLQMHSLLLNLREMKYAEKKHQIDILELEEQINDESIGKFEKMRKQLDLEKLKQGDLWKKKLVSDAIQQLNLYYSHFQKLPKFTKQEFENQEALYFQQTQNRYLLGITGAKEAIMNMIDDKKTMEQFEEAYAALPDEEKHKRLEETIMRSMASMIEFKENQ